MMASLMPGGSRQGRWIMYGVGCALMLGAHSVRAAVTESYDPGASQVRARTDSPFEERLESPITANFYDVDFESAMAFLSESARVNIVISQKARDFSKPVTVHLIDMPLRNALNSMVKRLINR